MAVEHDPALIIQMAKSPLEGRVKTRMMPQLDARQACELHCELVLWVCRRLLRADLGRVEMAVAGDPGHPLFDACRRAGVDALLEQRGTDLGERMYAALQEGLTRFSRVLLVGSDCPAIDRSYLDAALAALEHAAVVLGPALDGGYVLIGAREVRPELFHGISWGGSAVFAQTVDRADQLGLEWTALAPLADVDRPQDLAQWQALRAREC